MCLTYRHVTPGFCWRKAGRREPTPRILPSQRRTNRTFAPKLLTAPASATRIFPMLPNAIWKPLYRRGVDFLSTASLVPSPPAAATVSRQPGAESRLVQGIKPSDANPTPAEVRGTHQPHQSVLAQSRNPLMLAGM